MPSCANSYLLNDVIRSPAGFNRSDVVVGTDCGVPSTTWSMQTTTPRATSTQLRKRSTEAPTWSWATRRVSGAFPSCTQPVLTEICLCCARSCYATEDGNAPAGSSIADGGKGKLALAVAAKTVTEARISESVSRILHLRFITGQFDPIAAQPYTKIGESRTAT
eukprot:COSAG01_NODE_94_length_26962_cov_9.110933_17_plen_164_part_00